MAQERKKNKQQQTEAQRLAHRKAVIEHSDNKFVAELTKNMDAFIYTKDFGTTSRKSTSQTEISLLI